MRPGPWLLSDGFRGKGPCTVPDVTPILVGIRKQEREGDKPASGASWAVNLLPVAQSPAPRRGAVSLQQPETREPPDDPVQGSFINSGCPRPRELCTCSQHPPSPASTGPRGRTGRGDTGAAWHIEPTRARRPQAAQTWLPPGCPRGAEELKTNLGSAKGFACHTGQESVATTRPSQSPSWPRTVKGPQRTRQRLN